jgi:hypothetical protein
MERRNWDKADSTQGIEAFSTLANIEENLCIKANF